MILIITGLILGVGIGLLCYFLGMVWWGACLMFLLGLPVTVGLFFGSAAIIELFYRKEKVIVKPKKVFGFYIYMAVDFCRIFLRIKVEKQGFEQLEGLTGYELVCNHQSIVDPFLLICKGKIYDIGFMMKKEVLQMKLIGRWMQLAGCYEIDRKNNRQGLEAIIHAINSIKAGRPIGIFIEGTRSKGPDMGEFRDGAFKMALKAQAPIVVAVVDNDYKVHSNFPWKKTKVLLKICKVIPYEEFKDLKTHEISPIVRNIMQEALDEYRNR